MNKKITILVTLACLLSQSLAQNCQDTLTCSDCNNFPQNCSEFNSEGSMCYYNYDTNECGDSISSSTCSNFNNMKDVCEDISGCTLRDDDSCTQTPSLSDCTELDSYKDLCLQNQDCIYSYDLSGIGSCISKEIYTCSDYNGLQKICDDIEYCAFKFTDNTCLGMPDNSDCSNLDNFLDACENSSGCMLNTVDNTCSDFVSYNDNCRVYDNHERTCSSNSDCQYNIEQNMCVANEDAVYCSAYDSYEVLCNSITQCSYNIEDNLCTDQVDCTTCSNCNGYEQDCNAANGCEFNLSDNMKCVEIPSYETECSDLDDSRISCENYTEVSCTYSDLNSCTEMDECKLYSGYKEVCNSQAGCTYILPNQCRKIPQFSDSSCTSIGSYSTLCNNTTGCGFQLTTYQCKDISGISNPTSCDQLDTYPHQCAETQDIDSNQCYYNSNNSCETQTVQSGCSDYHSHEAFCNEQSTCSYNNQDSQCVAPPTYNNQCSDLNEFRQVCEDQDGCVYNYDDNLCVNQSEAVNCESYNRFQKACEFFSECSYQYSTGQCKQTPDCSSDCSNCNGFKVECSNEDTCSYSLNQATCAPKVSYGTDCNDMDNYEIECQSDSRCIFNNATNVCNDKSTVQTSIFAECSNHHEYMQSCDNTTDCSFSSQNNECGAKPPTSNCSNAHYRIATCNEGQNCGIDSSDGFSCIAFSGYNNACSDLSKFKDACDMQSGCNYDSSNHTCVDSDYFLCSEFNRQETLCNGRNECAFNQSDKTCDTKPSTDTCADYTNYSDLCEQHDDCTFNTNTNTCVSDPKDLENCSEYDGLLQLCGTGLNSVCTVKFESDEYVCVKKCNDSSNCSQCNNNENSCYTECAYNSIDDTCEEIPEFDNLCSIFNGFPSQICTSASQCQKSGDNCIQKPSNTGSSSESILKFSIVQIIVSTIILIAYQMF